MGAASADIPAIYLPAGPMLRGNYRGGTLGSGTDLWKFWDDKRAGLIGDASWPTWTAASPARRGTA